MKVTHNGVGGAGRRGRTVGGAQARREWQKAAADDRSGG
jgi:hypothetical protein